MLTNWPAEFTWPDYEGGSIANIPATVASLLEAPFQGLPPLRSALWRPLSGEVRRVVVLVLDAFGWNLWQRERERLLPLIATPTIEGQITSVFPSTTVNALSCIWTGAAPAQHGLVGLHLFFPHLAVLGQMLSMTPEFFHAPDALVRAGLNVDDFLAAPLIATQLRAAGVVTHAWKGWDIVDSSLSRMHSRDVAARHGATSLADMLTQISAFLESRLSRRLYVYAYWPTIDTLSHTYGWEGASVSAEAQALFYQIQTFFLDKLSPAARAGTVFILTADHGQTLTPFRQRVLIEDHPDLQRLLLMRNAGEPRVPYLYARQGRVAEVVAYINTQLSDHAYALPAEAALASGLLGPPPHAATTVERLGDVVMLMRGGAGYVNPHEKEKAQRFRGLHGGLTAAEMQAPWLAFRL
jgi:predicted AlkP superfamily pyrophosphatase or phosphodiesterase